MFIQRIGALAVCCLLLVTTVSTALAQAATATLSGTVASSAGRPIPGARITVSGPAQASATSGDDGTFSIGVPPGIYQITVDRGGYQTVSLSDVTAAVGTTQPVTVTLSETSLGSLRTIGTVTATAGGRS